MKFKTGFVTKIFHFMGIFIFPINCQSQPAIEDISKPPPFVVEDEKYANVFKPLDGKWCGQFFVYEDSSEQHKGNPQPEIPADFTLSKLSLKLILVIDVEQEYSSESPYFQRVKITDTYTNVDETKEVVESAGVNKVQNSELWCVVVKPDEKVIHTGKSDGENVIIWQRDLRHPLKIEYFRETVFENKYRIIGWGYYGNDDPNLNPKMWFEGLYHRVE